MEGLERTLGPGDMGAPRIAVLGASWGCHNLEPPQQSAGPFGLLVWHLLAGDMGKEGSLGLDPNHSWADILPHNRTLGMMKVR